MTTSNNSGTNILTNSIANFPHDNELESVEDGLRENPESGVIDPEQVHINLRKLNKLDSRIDLQPRKDVSDFRYESPYSKLPPLNIHRKTTPSVKYKQKELD